MAGEMTLKGFIGEKLLNKIQDSYSKYLDSSAAIYETNGEYAAALFSSRYCDFLNQASRKLAGKSDKQALKSGKWICHEDCWATSRKAMKDKKPCEQECSGGIKIFAVPITADGMVIGSNNAGVSNPPTDEKRIKEIAGKYKVDAKELLRIAREYVPRPDYVLDAAKNHIRIAADNIAEFFLRRTGEEKMAMLTREWEGTFDAIADLVFIQDKDFIITKVNKAFASALKAKPEDIIGKKCYELLHKSDKPWPDCPFAKTVRDKTYHSQEVEDPNIGIPLLVSTSPIFGDKGELTGSVHIAKNITDLKKAEEELKTKMRALEVFQKSAVGRELKMTELKQRIKELEARLSGKS
jgi:PAS domain S-box-containing protein